MMSVQVKSIEPILKDDRGSFFEVANDQEIRHIVVTTFTKGAIRGNQFRNNMDQYFFLVSGQVKVITKPIDNGSRQVSTLSSGSLIYIPRKTAFVTVADEASVLLEYSPQHYDPKNPDINRMKLI